MSAPALPQGLAEIADGYDALLCDVWGVIHNGREAFPAPCEALARFRRERGPVVLISNSPRPLGGFVDQLRSLGVPDEAWSEVVTSGEATRALLAGRAPGPAWALGPARDAPLYEGLDLELTETIDGARFISCTGLFDDDIETPEDYRARFQLGVARGLDMVCANPDKVVRRGDQLIWCSGALADLYEAMGGKVVMAGKPHAAIYDLARRKAMEAQGQPLDRILAIGDGIPTDVKGANDQGLDCLFIADGIHAADLLGPDGRLDAGRTEAMLAREGRHAAYVMGELHW
jgi:HAD superfamily hydrolase (TIGR01459 family)